MKIAMIAHHACVRVDKVAWPLVDKGYEIHLIANRMPFHNHLYKTVTICANIVQFQDSVDMIKDKVDLFHAHNEPSWFVTLVKERSDKPVILDVHDSFLARSTPEEAEKTLEETGKQHRITSEERNNFQLADGLVFPGEAFGNLVRREFKLNQPYATVPSYCTKHMQMYDPTEWEGGLVYEGRIDIPSDIKNVFDKGFKYCDYYELAQKAAELEIDFHVYPCREDKEFKDLYEPITILHSPKVYGQLIRYLSKHDWGIVGNTSWSSEWEIAFPNKMFEYISAGVPVVAINAKESSQFIENEGIGITVQSLEELTERWSEHTQIRKRLLRQRQRYTMDAHIHLVENLYKEVLG